MRAVALYLSIDAVIEKHWWCTRSLTYLISPLVVPRNWWHTFTIQFVKRNYRTYICGYFCYWRASRHVSILVSCTSHTLCCVRRQEKSRSHLSHPWHELLSPFPRWRPAPSLSFSSCLAAREQIVPQQQTWSTDTNARTLYMRKFPSCRQPFEREKFVTEQRDCFSLKVCLPLT